MKGYLNFPIYLLNGFMDDDKATDDSLSRIMYYAIAQALLIDKVDLHTMCKNFGWKVPDEETKKDWLQHGGELVRMLPLSSSPKVGISIETWRDFKYNTKTDYDKATLLAYLAIKSILGKAPYKKVSKDLILHRMAGHRNTKDYPLPDNIKIFGTKYRWRKIRDDLKRSWKVSIYADNTRGMWISTELTLKVLVLGVLERREKKGNKEIRLEELKKMEAQQIEEAKQIHNQAKAPKII